MFQRRKGHKRKWLAGIATVVAIAWAAGLFLFVSSIPKSVEAPTRKADAVVVLTGGTLRLDHGLDLLSQGLGKKLFVSGVHRGIDVTELLRVSRQTPGRLDCCIALGYDADDTRGNAQETVRWVREQGYKTIRLVTASYHMPRSLLEMHQVMPDVEILVHPVFPNHVKVENWYRWPGTSALIVGEYNKYLLAPVRWFWQSLWDDERTVALRSSQDVGEKD